MNISKTIVFHLEKLLMNKDSSGNIKINKEALRKLEGLERRNPIRILTNLPKSFLEQSLPKQFKNRYF